MKVTSTVLNQNHFRYSYYRNKSSDQYAIFLLGALQDIESVHSFSTSFADKLNCITIEVPGTGLTDPLDSTVSIRDQARMLLDLIQYLNIPSCHVIGFSYATAVAVELCDLWPNVQSLSISGGVPGIPESGRHATKKMIAAAMEAPKSFARTFTQSLTVKHSAIPRNSAIIKATERGIAKMSQERIDVFFENSVRLLVHKPSNVEQISVPCTICIGEYDPYATKEIAKAFANQLKNSHFVVVKNADHLMHLQYPEKVAAIMIAQAVSSIELGKTLENLT